MTEKELLINLTVAVNRYMQNLAEADDAVRLSLWRAMGAAAQAAEEVVYPLGK